RLSARRSGAPFSGRGLNSVSTFFASCRGTDATLHPFFIALSQIVGQDDSNLRRRRGLHELHLRRVRRSAEEAFVPPYLLVQTCGNFPELGVLWIDENIFFVAGNNTRDNQD